MKYVINCTTGEEIVREMTKTELAEEAASAKAYAETMAKAEAKEVTKASLLERLGITEDEAKLLLS